MSSFRFNLKGQLNEVKLPEYKALWPLFETIVNSIQSIEDSPNNNSGKIVIKANRIEERQIDVNGNEEITPFSEFVVIDNGDGFNTINYNSFLEAYSSLKITKGCKGIGRFLWLKAFSDVHILSNYCEGNVWYTREFVFSADNAVEPEDNVRSGNEQEYMTTVTLRNFSFKYRKKAPLSLESLAKKIVEHCLPYFLGNSCPEIILEDNIGESFNLNQYFDEHIKDSLHQDRFKIQDKEFTLYHIRMTEGVNKHEIHLCANKREVKSFDLSQHILDLQKRIVTEDGESYYYLGYLTGEYLDENVNLNRTAFEFEDDENLFGIISEIDLVNTIKEYIVAYLIDDLEKVKAEKREFIDKFVQKEKPQYRYLLNRKPELYNEIPANLSKDKLELELHRAVQQWENEIIGQRKEIENSVKDRNFDKNEFSKIFNAYCSSVTEISKSSLSEYVIRRKSILDLLEKAIEIQEDNKYCSEETLHSIICPMRYTSDEIDFEEMNLWIIDDRLAYHTFLASDKQMKSLPVIDTANEKRMDIAIFDEAFSFSENKENFNSISIIEFKKPNRNDLKNDDKNPINQVLGYVKDIKEGKAKKPNGRPFVNVGTAAFYCYVIADLTDSMKEDAVNAGLIVTPDGDGYYGYNQTRGAYIEVISYDKLVRDAKQRNQILFDKLFNPKVSEVLNSKLLC
ncbi:MAG: hypothetical protein LBR68_02950 [Lachnoclostridium sp.]|jgi:hypothetical protein|nr:hypothetical protein [Lachnoclostridium sp.]